VVFALVLTGICGFAEIQATEIRFNCAGNAYISQAGDTFDADQPWSGVGTSGYTAGTERTFLGAYGGTPDPDLHKTSRVNWAYRFDVPNGTYVLELLFVDYSSHGPGNNVFDVYAEGIMLLDELDIFAEGEQIWYAFRQRFAMEVLDGSLFVSSPASVGSSLLAAISVWDSVTDTIPPATPSDFEAFGGYAQNLLHWSEVPDEDLAGFKIYRATAPEGPFSELRPDLAPTRRFFDLNVQLGFSYYYAVSAVDVYGNESVATDTLVAVAMDPESTPLEQYEIIISAANWDWLNDHVFSDTYVPATFVADDVSYDVEVRYRGSSTRHLPKKSWKLRFIDGAVFNGREKLNLNAEWPDRTLMRENLAYEFLNGTGVIAAMAEHIQLVVNGRDYGVFTSVEELESEFLDRVGLDTAGSLYRCFGNLSVLPDTAAYMEAYEKKNNNGVGYADLIQFIELINYTPSTQFFETITQVFDLEHFYNYYGANVALGNVDFGDDDYFLYHEPTSDVWIWLPWDYNETYGIVNLFNEALQYEGDLFPSQNNQLITRLHNLNHFRRRHMDRVLQLMDTEFSPEQTSLAFADDYAEIMQSGRLDWFKWKWDDNTDFDAGVPLLESFVQLRTDFLLDEMAASPAPNTLVINEFMADNFSNITDEYGEHDDWLEITNAFTMPLALGSYYISDNFGIPRKWVLPDTTLMPGEFLVIWCDKDTLQGPLHANFRLSAGGEEIGIFDRDSNFNVPLDTKTFGPQYADVAFGRTEDAGYFWDFLPTPTPGGSNVTGGNYPPRIVWTDHEPELPAETDTVWVTAELWDDSAIQHARLYYDAGAGFVLLDMQDDGSSHDGGIGDGVYGAAVPPQADGTRVRYFVEAVDDSSVTVRDPRDAPVSTHFFDVGFVLPPLYVNEFLASNTTTNQDEANEYDDWLEIFNAGPDTLQLGGKHLTDNLTLPTKWTFPDTSIAPGGFLLVWCDEDQIQGPLHTNFKLSASGEEIGLFEADSNGVVPIDTYVYGPQTTDVSEGRLPDGSEDWVFFTTPTPGQPNEPTDSTPHTGPVARVMLGAPVPNPAPGAATLVFAVPNRSDVRLEIFDVGGRRVRALVRATLPEGHYQIRWDGKDDARRAVSSGVYFCRLEVGQDQVLSRKLLIAR